MDRPGAALARSRSVRIVAGAAIGLVLLAVTIARVDLGAVVAVLAGAAAPTLLVAAAVVLFDLAIRGARWQVLLRGVRSEERPAPDDRAPLRLAVAYLTIGYLANVLLPARLGDLARAYLAGAAFRLPRLPTLGTIMVERVADGGTMLGLAVVSSLVVAGIAAVRTLALFGLVVAAAGFGALALAWWLIVRTAFGRTSPGLVARDLAARLSAGMAAARTPTGAVLIAAATLAAAGTAILVAWLVSGAVGIALSPAEATLFMSAIALSLAIPAAPGSLGTYEFVGVVVLTSLGHSAERAFATIVLMRAVSTFPPIALGILSTWGLHLRPAAILETADALSPSGIGGTASS